jgi:hypothetical protein
LLQKLALDSSTGDAGDVLAPKEKVSGPTRSREFLRSLNVQRVGVCGSESGGGRFDAMLIWSFFLAIIIGGCGEGCGGGCREAAEGPHAGLQGC